MEIKIGQFVKTIPAPPSDSIKTLSLLVYTYGKLLERSVHDRYLTIKDIKHSHLPDSDLVEFNEIEGLFHQDIIAEVCNGKWSDNQALIVRDHGNYGRKYLPNYALIDKGSLTELVPVYIERRDFDVNLFKNEELSCQNQ